MWYQKYIGTYKNLIPCFQFLGTKEPVQALREKKQRASLPHNLSCGDQRASLPWSWWRVFEGLLHLGTWAVATKGLLYLYLDGRWSRGFSTLEPELWRPRGFSTSEPWMIERLLYLNLELWHCSWRFVHGDLSFEDLFTKIFRLKICLQRFVFWRFVHEDLSFEDFLQEKQRLI